MHGKPVDRCAKDMMILLEPLQVDHYENHSSSSASRNDTYFAYGVCPQQIMI